MVLGRYILTALGLDLMFSKQVIIGGDGPYKGCLAPMSDISEYDSKSLTYKSIKVEEPFINLYVDT